MPDSGLHGPRSRCLRRNPPRPRCALHLVDRVPVVARRAVGMVGLARERDGRIRHLPHLSRLRVPGQLARHRHPPHAACVRGRDGPQPATGWTARPPDAALPWGSAPRQRHTRPARSSSRRASHANAHRSAVSSGCSSRRRCRPPACCPGGALAIPSPRAESRGAGCGIRAGQAGRDEAQCPFGFASTNSRTAGSASLSSTTMWRPGTTTTAGAEFSR